MDRRQAIKSVFGATALTIAAPAASDAHLVVPETPACPGPNDGRWVRLGATWAWLDRETDEIAWVGHLEPDGTDRIAWIRRIDPDEIDLALALIAGLETS